MSQVKFAFQSEYLIKKIRFLMLLYIFLHSSMNIIKYTRCSIEYTFHAKSHCGPFLASITDNLWPPVSYASCKTHPQKINNDTINMHFSATVLITHG